MTISEHLPAHIRPIADIASSSLPATPDELYCHYTSETGFCGRQRRDELRSIHPIFTNGVLEPTAHHWGCRNCIINRIQDTIRHGEAGDIKRGPEEAGDSRRVTEIVIRCFVCNYPVHLNSSLAEQRLGVDLTIMVNSRIRSNEVSVGAALEADYRARAFREEARRSSGSS